jgi:hypothetical protein
MPVGLAALAGGDVAEGGRQGKIIAWIGAGAAVVGAFVGLYTILHRPSTEVADYQRQVQATCGRVHDLLAADHSAEIIDLTRMRPGQSPLDLPVRTDALLRVLRANLTGARQEFALLDAKPVPDALGERARRAAAARRDWTAAFKAAITRVERAGEGLVLRDLAGVLGGDAGPASARLNDTMTALAGADCRVTA